ncbi:hypothetical protein NHX12_028577, partial [Muraenolepis orangiensis]
MTSAGRGAARYNSAISPATAPRGEGGRSSDPTHFHMSTRPLTELPRLGPGATPATPLSGGTLDELYGGLQ